MQVSYHLFAVPHRVGFSVLLGGLLAQELIQKNFRKLSYTALGLH
jgi:hypothetical protein